MRSRHGFFHFVAHKYFSTSLATRNRLLIRQLPLRYTRNSLLLIPSVLSAPRIIYRLRRNKSINMIGTNGVATRSKRKSHPTGPERPQKQLRALNGKESTGVNTPEIDLSDDDYDIDGPQLLPPNVSPDTAEWQATIERVVRNVVSIRFCQTCSFDTDPALTSEATGFVVDAERGLVFPAQMDVLSVF